MILGFVNKIKYFFILALFLVIPIKAWPGAPETPLQVVSPIATTDQYSCQLYFVWDCRDRDTKIQVTSPFTGTSVLHIQFWNDNRPTHDCEENSIFDTLTPNDTNIYDVCEDLVADDPDGFGFGVITASNCLNSLLDSGGTDLLFGNIRIIDGVGYEYRVNMPAFPIAPLYDFSTPGLDSFNDSLFGFTDLYTFNFTDENGASQSDVFGFALNGVGFDDVESGGVIAALFGDSDDLFSPPNLIFNANEIPSDCDKVVFHCGEPNQEVINNLEIAFGENIPQGRIGFEFGINPLFPSSRAGVNLCSAQIAEGFMRLPLIGITEGDLTDPLNFDDWDQLSEIFDQIHFAGNEDLSMFVGFIGLNDGLSIGSMDTWWACPGSTTVGLDFFDQFDGGTRVCFPFNSSEF